MKYLSYEGLQYLYAKIKARLDQKVDKISGKGLSANDYTAAEKSKLAGIAANANNYVHPTTDGNKHVPATGTTSNGKILQAGAAAGAFSWVSPTKSMVGLGNVDNTPDAGKPVSAAQKAELDKKVDKVSGKQLSTNDYTTAEKNKLAGITANANNYVHPTTSGNKHIPSGGASGQVLRWNADGTAAWGTDNNTTYAAFKGATSSAAGGAGLVPAPAAGKQAQYLRGDGTWQTPPDTNTTYGAATASAAGLMSAADKAKLNGIAAGANNYVHPSTHPASMITQDAAHRFATDAEKVKWNEIDEVKQSLEKYASITAAGEILNLPGGGDIAVTGEILTIPLRI